MMCNGKKECAKKNQATRSSDHTRGLTVPPPVCMTNDRGIVRKLQKFKEGPLRCSSWCRGR